MYAKTLSKINVSWSTLRDFTSDNVQAFAPTSAGVYLLWVKLQNGNWRCYYVGQASNLEQRLLSHLSFSESNDCIKNHVAHHINAYCCATVANQSDRDGIEKFLYDHFKPECNQQDPGGTPIPVNTP